VLLDRYLAGGVNYQPTSSVADGEKAPMRTFYESTGFVGYLPAALCHRIMEENPEAVIFGRLGVAPTGYNRGTVISDALHCAVTIPSREALNRALDGDMVYVLLDSSGEMTENNGSDGDSEGTGGESDREREGNPSRNMHFRAYENWTFSPTSGASTEAERVEETNEAAEAAETAEIGDITPEGRPAVVVKRWRDVTGSVICRVPACVDTAMVESHALVDASNPSAFPDPMGTPDPESASYASTQPLLCSLDPTRVRRERYDLFVPLDTRYPRIRAETNLWALSGGKADRDLRDQKFVVQIKGWIPQSRIPYGDVLKIVPLTTAGGTDPASGAGLRALEIARGNLLCDDECTTASTGTDPENHAGPHIPEGRARALTLRGPQEDVLDVLCSIALTNASFVYSYPPHCETGPYLSAINEATQELCDSCSLTLEQVTAAPNFSLEYGKTILQALAGQRKKGVFTRAGRRDFSADLVYTIDPDTARDFDDAIHLSPLYRDPTGEYFTISWDEHMARRAGDVQHRSPSNWRDGSQFAGYEVGVHIADTTYYLDRAPELDTAAQATTTSVYLVDRCCPMLPTCLSNGLCSLNPLVPRYSFSVVVRLSPSGLVLPQKVWFGRGVIVSKARLDYVAAQRILDDDYTAADINPSTTGLFEQNWPCLEGQAPNVAASVKAANCLARALRAQRNKRGALMLSGEPKRYAIDKDTLRVSIMEPEMAADSHHLIEEFMLVANQLVARRLLASFPSLPIVRLHPPPSSTDQLQAELQALQLPRLETESGATVIRSLDRVGLALAKRRGLAPPLAADLSRALFLSTSLSRAQYHIGTSSNLDLLSHWGIHAALYMHFTSPIRRYADDIAHRMLSKGLALEVEAKEACGGEEAYRASAEYQDRPHEVVFSEEVSLYDALTWTPRKALLREVDSRYNATEEFEAAGHETVAGLMDDLADGVLSSAGRHARAGKHSARLAQALREIAARATDKGAFLSEEGSGDDRGSSDSEEGGQGGHNCHNCHNCHSCHSGHSGNPSSKDTMHPRTNSHGDLGATLFSGEPSDQSAGRATAVKVLDDVEKDLASIGYSFSALRTLADRCNAMAKQEELAEAIHRRLMLRVMLDRRQKPADRGYITATAFLVSYDADKGVIGFSIPDLEMSAQASLKIKLLTPARVSTDEFDPQRPLELQEGSKRMEVMGRAEHEDLDALDSPAVCIADSEDDLFFSLTNPPASASPRARTRETEAGVPRPKEALPAKADRGQKPRKVNETVFELLEPLKCRIIPIDSESHGNVGVLLQLPGSGIEGE